MSKSKIKSSEAVTDAAAGHENLADQMARMKNEGYSVFPASFASGNYDMVSQLTNVLNFSGLTQSSSPSASGVASHLTPVDPLASAGGFMSSGSVIPSPHDNNGNEIGTPGKGYIAWGSSNNLPNIVSLANSSLVYTALPLKFNIDTLCGLGVEPVYRFHATVGCNENEEEIAYEHAGSYIQSRIHKLRTQLYNLLKDASSVSQASAAPSSPESNPSDDSLSSVPSDANSSNKRLAQADQILDELVGGLRRQIAQLEAEYKTWQTTLAALNKVISNSNPPRLTHDLATDMASFYIAFPELDLTMEATTQPDSAKWKPRITAIRYRDALACRLEEKDQFGVSRYVYMSNQWLDPANTTLTAAGVSGNEANKFEICAVPALDPTCAASDLLAQIRKFRTNAAVLRDAKNPVPASSRPTRWILPIDYRTSGRFYYPQPPYYTVYRDIYQYAANIIRDRAIRKQNENMFSYVLYVHQTYLERLTNQINAQKTEDEKKAMKEAEIAKIKNFLSSKQNNGSTLAACTFTGSDGKDHDAFRVQRIEYSNTKQNAEADKTEITDISSIIMFAFECHPDLIGSTPGGASSSGGTYQREMLLIKQSKVAPMQQLMLYPWFVTRDFNQWDPHLSFRIRQRVLTTLDNSKTGTVDE